MICWTKFAQKGCFWSKTKSEYHHWILQMRMSLGNKFQLKLTCWFFGPNLPYRVISSLKQKRWTPPLNSAYSIYIFFDQICPKRVFPVKTEKSEHDQWILHIRINISTKFQLKLTILIFWTNLPKKGISGSRKIAFARASKRYFDFSSQRLLTFTSFKQVLRYWANLLACLCAFDFEPQLVIFKHVLN